MKRLVAIVMGAFAVIVLGAANVSPAMALDPLEEGCKGTASNSPICDETKDAEKNTNEFIQNIISTLLFVLGIIAVIVIIIGGIRYATSGGDSSQISSAKDTILYAVIGLIVAILAYAIVNFVIGAFAG